MLSDAFIKATASYNTYDKPVCAPYLRKTFTLDALPEKASVTLTCTGFYRLFVNGTEVNFSRLAPYISNPDQMIFYDTYDVTPLLRKGKNCLAFLLGNGISDCVGGYIWDFDKAYFRSAPKLAVHFESDALSFEADESFRCAPSPVFFDDMRSGEFYDATKEIDGWDQPDFDDSAWTPALPTDPARGEKRLNDTDPVVITGEYKALSVTEADVAGPLSSWGARQESRDLSETAFFKPEETEHGFVFSFAENTACVPKLTIRGRRGQRIMIQASEHFDGKTVDFANVAQFYPRGFAQRDIYICKGEGTETYIPSFTYHGARHFLVIGADKEQITPETVTMLVQNTDLRETGNFSCSDAVACRLQRMARVSDLANFVYFPTDCPHREKNGWTGDASMSAEHMMQTLSVGRSFKQWLRTVCAAQRADGALPGIVPTSGWGFTWGNGPAWDQVIVELPYVAYIYRGDTEPFRICADSVMRYLNYIAGKRDGNGLVAIGLGDWLPADRDDPVCPLTVSDTAIVYNICRKAEFLFGVCGMETRKAWAKLLGDEVREAFRRCLIDFDTVTVSGACQSSQSIGLYYGLFDKGEEKQAYDVLLRFIHEADDHFDGGMIGLRTIFRTLALHGDGALAYHMITRTDPPSYGVWSEVFGLTSLAETVRSWFDVRCMSYNHHFMGDFSGFFIAHIAGLRINPDRDDPAFVRFAPTFVPTLTHAEAYYETVAGRVSVRWERKDDKIVLTVEKADGVRGDVVLPDGYVFCGITSVPELRVRGTRTAELADAVYTVKKA